MTPSVEVHVAQRREESPHTTHPNRLGWASGCPRTPRHSLSQPYPKRRTKKPCPPRYAANGAPGVAGGEGSDADGRARETYLDLAAHGRSDGLQSRDGGVAVALLKPAETGLMNAGKLCELRLRETSLRAGIGEGLANSVHELAVLAASSRHGAHRPRVVGGTSKETSSRANLLPATPTPEPISMPTHPKLARYGLIRWAGKGPPTQSFDLSLVGRLGAG